MKTHWLFALVPVAAACSSAAGEVVDTTEQPLTNAPSDYAASVARGETLFKTATFDGNGRTCLTCHSAQNGTVTLAQIAAAKRTDPLFVPLDSDDGTGATYARVKSDSTFKVQIDLPSNIRLKNAPTATKFTVYRTALTTNDIGLDPWLMWDGRDTRSSTSQTTSNGGDSDLANQAAHAILAHAQPTVTPSTQQLTDIANYEKDKLYSRPELSLFAHGGPIPAIPEGTTDAERRGRAAFSPNRQCGFCHSDSITPNNTLPPLLNGSLFDNRDSRFFGRFAPALAGELPGESSDTFHPKQEFVVTWKGRTYSTVTRDPGALITSGGDPAFLFAFKNPNLRNIKNTAPYFHDGSAKTLEAVLDHYQQLMLTPLFHQLEEGIAPPGLMAPLSDQDKSDIVAFLKLL